MIQLQKKSVHAHLETRCHKITHLSTSSHKRRLPRIDNWKNDWLEICILAACAGIWPRAELSTPSGENKQLKKWSERSISYIVCASDANLNGTLSVLFRRRRQVCALEIINASVQQSRDLMPISRGASSQAQLLLLFWCSDRKRRRQWTSWAPINLHCLDFGPEHSQRNWCSNCSSIRQVHAWVRALEKWRDAGVDFAPINEQRENENLSS